MKWIWCWLPLLCGAPDLSINPNSASCYLQEATELQQPYLEVYMEIAGAPVDVPFAVFLYASGVDGEQSIHSWNFTNIFDGGVVAPSPGIDLPDDDPPYSVVIQVDPGALVEPDGDNRANNFLTVDCIG